MNKTFFFITALFFANDLLAQDAIFFQRGDSTSILDSAKQMISANGSYYFDSNALYNELTTGLILGRDISREVRDHSQEALSPMNRVGDEFQVSLLYRHFNDSLFGSDHWGWQIGLSHNEVLGVKFSEDMYNLTFYGNEPYEDKTAYMDGSNQTEVKYQKVGFGFFEKHTLSSATLSLVKGQKYVYNDLRKASLYTAPDGVYLDLDMEGTLESSDSTKMGFEDFNGIGAALDLEWNVPLKMFGRNNHFSHLSLSIHDLGFVSWNDQSSRAEPDTLIRYEGISVDNIFDLDGVIVDDSDLLDSLGVHVEKGAYTRMLPVTAQLALRSRFHSKWYGELGLRYRDIRAFTPHVWLNVSYLPREQFRLTFLSGYGGFGGFRVGIGTEVLFADQWYFRLRTSNLIGSISESAQGQQVELGISALF